jgi:D-amino peptidase
VKVYIICDIEGTAGVVDFARQCIVEGAEYDRARRAATDELNAAVEGALAGGATYVVAWDGHGPYPGGIDPFVVHKRCELVTAAGAGGPIGMDGSFDAMIMVGLHARAGTPGGVLAHSFNDNVA